MMFSLPQWCHKNPSHLSMRCCWTFNAVPMSSDNSREETKLGRSEMKFIQPTATQKRKPHNPLLKVFRAHLGGSASKITALPRHRDQPYQGSVFNWTERGRGREPGDKVRGGWGRIYDLSSFPFFCWKNKTLGSVPAEMRGAHIN